AAVRRHRDDASRAASDGPVRAWAGLGRGVCAWDEVTPREGATVEAHALAVAVRIRRPGDADLEVLLLVRRHAVPVDGLGDLQRTELAGVGDDRRDFRLAPVTRNGDRSRRITGDAPAGAGIVLSSGVVTWDQVRPRERAAVEANGL